MKFLNFLIAATVAGFIAAPRAALSELIIYKGTLKQTATGQGASEKLSSNIYLILDQDSTSLAQVQFSTSGKTKIYSTTTSTNFHIVQVAGAKGKNIEAIVRTANSCDLNEGNTSEDVFAQGTPAVLALGGATTVTFPKVLSGSSKVISSDGAPTYIESTLVASFDASQTPLSNANGESVDAAVTRITGSLQSQGYTTQLGQSKSGPLAITNDTMVTTWSDSFARAQFGQRQNFFLGSYFINYYPQHFVSYRDHSRSGGSNFEMMTQRVPMYGIPDAGTSHGKTNGLNIFYVSENGGYDSNSIYGFFQNLLQFPAKAYNRAGILTADWTQPNPRSTYSSIVIGDIAYRGGTAIPHDYCYGGRSAAAEVGAPFVDSWNNLINVVTNNDSTPDVLWFPNGGAYDHPNNVYQLLWTLTNLRSLGVDTNTYTAVIDFNTATVSQTNHCAVTGITSTGTGLSFIFHADRMAPGFYVPDGNITNDCRGAFTLMPSLGNQFCEIIKVINLPQGNYNLSIDGSNVVTLSSAKLSAGYNAFTNYNGAFWAQKKEVLGLMCDMLDVSRSDASTDAHPGDNVLNQRYESYANARWPTNNFGVDQYITQMSDRESELQAEDVLIHAAAQQTNHLISITPVP